MARGRRERARSVLACSHARTPARIIASPLSHLMHMHQTRVRTRRRARSLMRPTFDAPRRAQGSLRAPKNTFRAVWGQRCRVGMLGPRPLAAPDVEDRLASPRGKPLAVLGYPRSPDRLPTPAHLRAHCVSSAQRRRNLHCAGAPRLGVCRTVSTPWWRPNRGDQHALKLLVLAVNVKFSTYGSAARGSCDLPACGSGVFLSGSYTHVRVRSFRRGELCFVPAGPSSRSSTVSFCAPYLLQPRPAASGFLWSK